MELDKEYDLIVLGTGFVESVIAGAAARSGKKVLHLDHNDYYGAYTSSTSLSGFENLITNTNPQGITLQEATWPSQEYSCIPAATNPAPKFTNVKIYSYDPPKTTETVMPGEPVAETTTETTSTQSEVKTEEMKDVSSEKVNTESTESKPNEPENLRNNFIPRDKLMASSRQFSIDIIPRLLFSRGEMVKLLISSSVGRYLEFKCLERTYVLATENIQPVPCSKADIFKSTYITNSERRMLTRFMQLITSDLAESGKIDPNSYSSFFDFIKSQKLSPNLELFVLYAISMCTADQQSAANKVGTAEGLRVLETYVSSVSKYGNTPFLCPMYGISELPQAFCRLCAVYSGIYVLRRSVQCLLVDPQTNQFKGVVCSEGQTLKALQFVTSGSYFPQLLGAAPNVSRSSRCVVVTSSAIITATGDADKDQATLLIVPPMSHSLNNQNAIHILQFDYQLSVTPKGKFILHFSTDASGTAEQDLERAVAHFLNVPQIADADIVPSKPYAQWIGYFNLNLHTPSSPSASAYPQNVYIVTEGPRSISSIDYKEQLEEAKEVFAKVCPDLEFLPKVPNPEDIIWAGGDGTQTETETTTDNGEGQEEGKEATGGQETNEGKEGETPAQAEQAQEKSEDK